MATHYLCKRGSKQEFHDCAFNQKFPRQDLSAMHRVQVRRRSTLPTLNTLHSALSCGTPRCQHVVPPCVPIFQCNVMWRAGGRRRGAFLAGQKSSHYLHRNGKTGGRRERDRCYPNTCPSVRRTFCLFLSLQSATDQTELWGEDDTGRRAHSRRLPIISKSPPRDKIK